jgi:hypothetical protein
MREATEWVRRERAVSNDGSMFHGRNVSANSIDGFWIYTTHLPISTSQLEAIAGTDSCAMRETEVPGCIVMLDDRSPVLVREGLALRGRYIWPAPSLLQDDLDRALTNEGQLDSRAGNNS